MKIGSREYKVMLDARRFERLKHASSEFMAEVVEVAKQLSLKVSGKLALEKEQAVRFYDTPDHSLRFNGVVLRRRDLLPLKETQYTLKCRTADRYEAKGKDLSSKKRWKPKNKFEEDIAAVFRSRYSQSTTLTFADKAIPLTSKQLRNIGDAASLFPFAGSVRRDGAKLAKKTKLSLVSNLVAHERVYAGQTILLAGRKTSLALIVWTKGAEGRTLVAEFSFRYKDKHEAYTAEQAAIAREFFARVQQLDWCAPEIPTKTQFAYRETRKSL